MEQTMNSLQPVKLSLLLVMCCVMCCAPLLAILPSNQSGKRQPIIAVLSFPEAAQCVGTKTRSIEATVTLTNTSATDISLRRGMGQNISIIGLFGTRTLRPLLSSWMSSSDAPLAVPTEVTIHPGATFSYSLRINLDAELLKEPGFYRIEVDYSAFQKTQTAAGENVVTDISADTRGAILEVRECDESAGKRTIDGREAQDETMSCQVPLPHALQDVTFTVVYRFEEKNGRPANIKKVKNDFLPDDKFLACMSGWTVPPRSKGVARFSHTPTGGWSTTVLGEGTETVDPRQPATSM
jgi:hypothetical protein